MIRLCLKKDPVEDLTISRRIPRRGRSVALLLMTLALSLPFFRPAFADPFTDPLDTIRVLRPQHVVSFRVIGPNLSDKDAYDIELRTRAEVNIYKKGLIFKYADGGSLEEVLTFRSSPEPTKAMDIWYKEVREFYGSGTLFTVKGSLPIQQNGTFQIAFEACSVKGCFLPVTFAAPAKPGEVAIALDDPADPVPTADSPPALTPVAKEAATPALTALPPTLPPNAKTALVQGGSDFRTLVDTTLKKGGLLLIPLLLLAGLLMNLTPCIYPLIPITLSVLSRSNGRRSHPWLYVLGITLTYSTMGLVAGLTGGLFGALLQSPAVTIGMALILIVLGFAMLGVIDLSRLQTLGSRIPLSESHPSLGVFVMGCVSGLVSAPCTGPVLASLLLVVSQTRDALYGFGLLFIFSLGFSLPYLLLGMASQKLPRLPKLGVASEVIKIVFAGLIFALALYFLRQWLSPLPGFALLFAKPEPLLVIIVLAATAMSFLLIKPYPWIGHVSATLLSTLGCLWLTLWALSSFTSQQSAIAWEKDWDTAVQRAQSEQKILLVDIWADWCAACKEMDATTWVDPEVVDLVNKGAVAVKIDFTTPTPTGSRLVKIWGLSGLPAVALFPLGARYDALPPLLFREKVERDLFTTAFRKASKP